jgi:hypothetical protein
MKDRLLPPLDDGRFARMLWFRCDQPNDAASSFAASCGTRVSGTRWLDGNRDKKAAAVILFSEGGPPHAEEAKFDSRRT